MISAHTHTHVCFATRGRLPEEHMEHVETGTLQIPLNIDEYWIWLSFFISQLLSFFLEERTQEWRQSRYAAVWIPISHQHSPWPNLTRFHDWQRWKHAAVLLQWWLQQTSHGDVSPVPKLFAVEHMDCHGSLGVEQLRTNVPSSCKICKTFQLIRKPPGIWKEYIGPFFHIN